MTEKTKITVRDNGPLRIEGQFELLDATGKAYDLGGREAVSLCRCGKSADTPFCDGSHSRCAFESKVTARDLPPKK